MARRTLFDASVKSDISAVTQAIEPQTTVEIVVALEPRARICGSAKSSDERPNCGAPPKVEETGSCTFCRAAITSSKFD